MFLDFGNGIGSQPYLIVVVVELCEVQSSLASDFKHEIFVFMQGDLRLPLFCDSSDGCAMASLHKSEPFLRID